MNVSAKIPQEAMIRVAEVQITLAKKGIRVTKTDIVDAAIKITTRDPQVIERFFQAKKKDNTRELFEKWLKADAQFEGDIIKEHDTVM